MRNVIKVGVVLFFAIVTFGGVCAMQDQPADLGVLVNMEVERFKTQYNYIRSDIDKIFKIAYVAAKQICKEQPDWKNKVVTPSDSEDRYDSCDKEVEKNHRLAYQACEKTMQWYKKMNFDSQPIILKFEKLLSVGMHHEINSDWLAVKSSGNEPVLEFLIVNQKKWNNFTKEYKKFNQSYKDKITALKNIWDNELSSSWLEGTNKKLFVALNDNMCFEGRELDIDDASRLVSAHTFEVGLDSMIGKDKIGIEVGKPAGTFNYSSERLLEEYTIQGLKFDDNYAKRFGIFSFILKVKYPLIFSILGFAAVWAYYHGYLQKMYSN